MFVPNKCVVITKLSVYWNWTIKLGIWWVFLSFICNIRSKMNEQSNSLWKSVSFRNILYTKLLTWSFNIAQDFIELVYHHVIGLSNGSWLYICTVLWPMASLNLISHVCETRKFAMAILHWEQRLLCDKEGKNDDHFVQIRLRKRNGQTSENNLQHVSA